MSAPAPVFDARPLTEPVDRARAKNFARHLRATHNVPGAGAGTVIAIIFAAVVGVIAITFLGAIFGAVVSAFASRDALGPAAALLGLLPLLFVGGIAAIAIALGVRARITRRNTWFRLDRFARANGMSYVPGMDAPALPGLIFGVGDSRRSDDLVRGDRPRFVEFANYRYTTGSGKERTTHSWGYVAVRLDVPLPNIVLDATSNNGLFGASNLPTSLDKAQRLSLEGDFDRYFSLYCPRGYERDALYLFTPDIMARFIDNAAALDVEIVDDWLFLYSRRRLSTLDPATWAWLFSVVGALLDKLAQWARWRDDRLAAPPLPGAPAAAPPLPAEPTVAEPTVTAPVEASRPPSPASALPFAAPPQLLRPPPGVAVPGRRLKRRFPLVSIIVLAVFVGIWLLVQAGVIGTLFSFMS